MSTCETPGLAISKSRAELLMTVSLDCALRSFATSTYLICSERCMNLEKQQFIECVDACTEARIASSGNGTAKWLAHSYGDHRVLDG